MILSQLHRLCRVGQVNVNIELGVEAKDRDTFYGTVTCMTIARERVGKQIPATQAHVTIEGHSLLGNGPANMHP
jgi:hypothetical protein